MNRRTPPISDPAIDSLLVSVREAIVTVTGSSLVGLYLFGSLAIGDFDSDVSDIDLIAALADTPSERTPRNGRVASRREPADSHCARASACRLGTGSTRALMPPPPRNP